MSEFTCRNNHLMSCLDRICPICSFPVHRMDGFTAQELMMQERVGYEELFNEEEEDEE